MVQKKTQEKREYLRVALTTQVIVKPVSRREFEQNKGMQIDQPKSAFREKSDKPGGLEPDFLLGSGLCDRLMRIEDKLDRILRKLEPEADPHEAATCGTARNISGAGVRLILEDLFDVGQMVMLSLSVPGFSIGFLHAYGEIVRVLPCKEKGGGFFDTSIKFVAINEKERDMLVSYTFHKQRQEIRGLTTAKEPDRELQNHGK